MFSWLFKLIASFTSFVLPIWASYKALESSDIATIQYLLMYWVVIGIFLTFETYLAPLVSLLPLYGLFRTCFLVWLVIPQFSGSSQIYLSKIQPLLKSHDVQIENFVESLKVKAKSFGSEYVEWALAYVKTLVPVLKNRLGAASIDGNEDSKGSSETTGASGGVLGLSSGSYSALYGLAGSLVSRIPSSGLGFAGFNRGFSGQNLKGVSIPATLTSKAEKLNFLQSQKDQLTQLLDKISEQQTQVQQEKEESSEDEFDVVKREEISQKGASASSGSRVSSGSGLSEGGKSTAVDSPNSNSKSKSWFRFR